ncbi:glycosyltransferase family 2 protein [Formosa maritima]|uniref:Glycosyltransferase family 2 protein n=1 Tax=Formosa maritima TaxID=2592046 RepID=A0A5D0GCN3_9FLAO|nr:glycosyltransferase family A protein [Formosa maritima]TYA56654.1 glycosyltransferase family 2 protein [Formosa maritima]
MKSNSLTYPLVSICIPTYNGEVYLVEALESAINQTYPHLEIIVSDDASKDGSLRIVDSYKTKTKIPIHVYHHEPQGIGANWNNCVHKAHGEYIKFLFQDDVLDAHCISKMMALALANPQLGMVYSKRDFIYSQLTPKLKEFIAYYSNLHLYWEDLKVVSGILSGKAYLKDKQFLNSPKNKIGEPTNVLLKKTCFDTVGYFNEELQQALDSDYWYRVMTCFDIGFIDETLASFRLHDKQASAVNKQREIPDKDLVYKLYYKELFWQLHPKNQWKLLKLHHPLVKRLVTLKQSFHAK